MFTEYCSRNTLLGLACLLLLRFGFASIDTTCLPPHEVDVLREIGSKLVKHWDFNEDPCKWVGNPRNDTYEDSVMCDNYGSTCHVVSISLRGQSLPGILPPEIANLSYLTNLDLAYNFLRGTIPREWGSMAQILNISLLGNRLTGSIPKELGNLTTLTYLTVEDNQMNGTIPEELGNLSSIQKLYLSSNNFSGELPASFTKLTTLKHFLILDNNFSGKIPDFIGNWTSLEKLRIQATGLEGPIPSSITLLKNLSELRISDLRGPDTQIPLFSKETRFKQLILRSCNLIGELPESLAKDNLKVLDFSFNKLNGSIPESFIDLQITDFIYLTGNSLSGRVPDWMLDSRSKNIDLSYNNFTFENSRNLMCPTRKTNLFASFSRDNISDEVSCLGNINCPKSLSSLYINCGGRDTLRVGNKTYVGDYTSSGDASTFYSFTDSHWGFSNTGQFLDDISQDDNYIWSSTSRVLGNNSELYMTARISAISLTYYVYCMRNGSYNISLHFAEIRFTNDDTYTSLGRRVFNIYIQGKLVERDFDISKKAGGVQKAIVIPYTVNVNKTLEIRFYWAGKGTTTIPFRGVYGPMISAISVDPNFPVPQEGEGPAGSGNGVSGGTVAGIVVGVVCTIFLVLGVLWWWGCLTSRDTMGLDLKGLKFNTGSLTLRKIKAATNNFDAANKIGEGGFGSVFKGVLPNGTLIAVKQLSPRSKQGNREFLNELGMISALQHPHLVKLHGCCIEGNQLLLAYEYMENNSLARALFGPEELQLKLDWPTRYKICIGIARGLSFLHEESRLKIVHRDIKATNVLLDKNLNAKISDFGLAKLDEEDNTHISTRIAGTYGYMAPEYALRGYLTDKADVYSYGIVLLEIVSGMANIVDRTKKNHFVLLDRALSLKTSGNLMELVDPRLGLEYDVEEMKVVINLALLCTSVSPTDRPTMSSVVSMLDGRIVPPETVVEQSISMTKIDHEKMMKQVESMNVSQVEEIPNLHTDSSASDVDESPADRILLKRNNDSKKLS